MSPSKLDQRPLGRPNYGSIPHLSGSRLGPSDRCSQPGQEAILTHKSKGRTIIVLEKLDGSNMGVARIGDEIIPLTRAGYRAISSPFRFQHFFHHWVEKRRDIFLSLLEDGERVVGEWLILAHGTRYHLAREEDLFVCFDFMKGKERAPYAELVERTRQHGLASAAIISHGPPLSIDGAEKALGNSGWHGADRAEGAVWRAEMNGMVEFLGKYVRHDKVDGHLLPEISGNGNVWNWSPATI